MHVNGCNGRSKDLLETMQISGIILREIKKKLKVDCIENWINYVVMF